ncbi:filamentous hemagglutinin N-terminal domain-containing protein, partial [Kalamiella sp. sgz302252]|uniref:two-partner secretion domain-containing protein n=1 Tax=Pantoea sp. sgz302252 TaxID=3341827 RepID=UPI0036D2F6F7
MNKNLYRVIFNQARGMLMVVAEIAASHGGISSPCASGQSLLQHISALTRLKFALAFALGCVSFAAGAGIVADRQAPGNQQPTIISAANGTPQINIQTPGAAGVSRNVYSQFDVDKKGAVLNNSHSNTQTQLAGMVTGNPWLAKGEAKIILNEVNASRASQLNGFIEVAGQKAQVVIANPAGITCDGCGFINAHRATLTTGQPQLSNGQLTGYDVERGEIVIQGAGLESRLQDKTDLIARAVKVNAGLWANELNVTTGRNKVDAAHQAVAPKNPDGSAKPTLAIDVAALGGMYANKIRLRGTEAGVGVANAGHIGASAGDVTVDASGMLTNTGSLTSSEQLRLTAQGAIASQGKIYAAGSTEIRTEAELVNTGSIAAAQNVSLSAASIHSASQSTLAAGVSSDGKKSASGNLILNSKGELRANGQNLAAGELAASGTKLDFSHSQTAADTVTLTAASGDITTAGARLAAARQLVAQTQSTLNNDGGELVADELKLTASRLSNQQGIIQQTGKHDLQLVHAAGINNRQGTISSSGENLMLQTTSLDNGQGVISGSGKNLTLQTDQLNNEQGKILHGGDGKLTLEAAQIAGSQSTVISNGALALNSATLVLDNAVTQAASIEVKADTLSSRYGQLLQSGNGTMKLTIAGVLDNQGGTLASAGALALSASDLLNQQGKTIVTDRYSLEAILANGLQNREGVIASGGDLKLSSQALDNSAGLLQSGGTLSLDTHQKELLNNSGTVYSTGSATLNTGDLTSVDGQILAQDLNITAQAVDNRSGTVQAQNGLVLTGGQVSNQQGTFAAGNTITLRSEAFDNSQGAIASNGTLTLQALSLANGSGRIGAQGDLLLETTKTTDNAAGLIYSAQSLTLTAEKVLNQNTRGASLGIQGNNITLNADELVNSQGAVLADERLSLTLGDQLDNSGGLISSLAETRLAAQRIDNEAGSLEAGSLLAVTGEEFNGAGRALSLGDMTLTLARDFTNGGTLQAEGNLTLASQGKIHNQALIQAGQTLSLTANGVQNDAAAEISAATTVLNAGKSLVNYGLIDGFTTRLNGDIVSNIGSGRIYGDALAIKAGTLNNLAANGVAATLAARQRLDIGATTINNRDHALIYSDGVLTVGGTLNGEGLATGQAATLNNHSATIESAGAMALNVREINNINDRFELENVLVSQEAISEYEVNRLKDGKRYNDKDYTIYIYKDETYIVCIEGVICGTTDGDRFTHYQYTRTITEDRVKETDPAKIIAGGSLQINAGSLLNDKSQIVAGGTLAVNAASVENVEVGAFRQINDAGLATAYSRHQEKGNDSPVVKVSDYVPPTVIQTIDLNASTLEDHTRAQSSNPNVSGYQTAEINTQVQGAGKNDRAQIVLPAGKTFEVQMQSGESVVRVAGPNISLPDNSLFMVQPQSTSAYLVETDPRFASQKQWLSSDYMMDAFATDPNNVLKRLGDGYYEQRLIREQVIALSGQRYLAGQQSDEEQYKMLMNNGIAFGKKYNLTPGVALTSEQMSLLTGDMVWMVTQSVQLADGSTQQVLVPQVYAVVKPGDLDGSGALLAANNIGLNLSGELTNSGRISSRQSTQILADTLTNLGGQLRGDSLEMKAQTDINNIGGVMAANSSLLLSAGRDINATTTTRPAESEDGRFARTTLDSVAGFYVEQSNGTLALQAGRDINLQAAQVVNSGEDGTLVLTAGRDLNLTTASTASRDNLSWGQDYQNHSTGSQIGTDIIGSGKVSLDAAQNISVTAGNISAGRQLSLTAGNDINLQHAVDTATLDQYYKATGSNGALSSKTVESRDTFSHQTVNGSQLSADSVTVQAGRDITVTGSSVAATQDVAMSAGNNLNIESATAQQQEYSLWKEKKSGISGTGGIGFTAGSSSLKSTDEGKVLSNTGSTLGSIEGSVNLSAGNALTVKGSDVLAGKDISLTGKEV